MRGGPYPLTRVIARFLDCGPTDVTVGFVTVDGWCIVRAADELSPDGSTVLDDVPVEPDTIAGHITRALAPG